MKCQKELTEVEFFDRKAVEAFAVRGAVRRHQSICQVGTQNHAGENYRRVVENKRP